MNIAVFGATGGTGLAVVDGAVRAGHHVTAVVRRAGSLGEGPGVRVVVLPAWDRPADLDQAVRNQDAVISALGTAAKGPVSVCTDGVRAIIGAMSRTGVRRLVVVSAHGAADSHDRSLYSRVLWATLADKMRDKEAMEEAIRASELDWTIVRPPALKNRSGTGRYRTATDLKIRLTSWISRADLADFLLREATSPAYLREAPRIAA